MSTKNDVVVISDGDVKLWTEDERSIHMKVKSPYGDPIELNAEEAQELAGHLLRLASLIE